MQLDEGTFSPSHQRSAKMEMWSKNTYFMETDYNSSPCPTGMMDPMLFNDRHALEMANNQSDYWNQTQYNMTTQYFDEMNEQYSGTRIERIRAAMFPETIEDDQTTSASQGRGSYDVGQSNNVQRLAEPSQMVKTAVVEVINYQDDAELATKAIPELIKLLSDKDEVVVSRAAQMVHLLSKQASSSHLVRGNGPLIAALVEAAARVRREETKLDMAGALFHISRHGPGLMHIFRSGGIPELVRMLGSRDEAVVNYAITTLHNLMVHLENAKPEVRACGGMEKMVPLLDRPDEKFLAVAADCTFLLMLQHPESKLLFLSCAGPPKLVHIIRAYNYEKLLYTSARNVKTLSVCPQNKSALVAAGAVQALQTRLGDKSTRLVRNVLLSLRNLSDAATKEDNVTELLIQLIQLMDSSDDQVVVCCAGILSNLSCNNARNKQTLCANGATPVLIRALTRYANIEDVTEPSLCALRHMTTRHPLCEQAQTDVRVYGGVSVVVQLLAKMRAPIAKAALGLIRNLAQLESNLVPLRDARLPSSGGSAVHTVVTLAVDVLTRAFTQIRETQMQGNGSVPITDGVTMNELIECAVGALHHMARESITCRQILDCRNVVPVLVQLLPSEVENIQRETTGLLYEISKTVEGARLVDAEGPTPILTDLIRSHNQATSTYASAVLKNLEMDKPIEYRKQLDMEIHSALYRDDSATWAQDGLGELQDMPADEAFADTYHSPAYDPIGLNDDTWVGNDQRHAMHYNGSGGQPRSGWYDTDL